MEHIALDPIGAEVSGLDPAHLDDGEVAELRGLLARHGVLALRGADLDDADFVSFLRRLGELAFTDGEPPVPGFPDLNPVSNVGRETPPKSNWHVDTSYVREPPAYTALRAVTIPEQGGETLFANQYRAWAALPAALREAVTGRTMTHVVSGVSVSADAESSAEHPLGRPHPLSGEVALYLTSPARCAAISGMTPEEKDATVTALLAHSTREENVHRHAWRAGDVVIWDNGAVLHRADHSGVRGDRVMHRGMVAGYAS